MNSPFQIRCFFGLILFFGSCKKETGTLFTQLKSSQSGIAFENTIVESPAINILTYEYTYNGGGVAAGDLNNDGLCDLYFTGNTVPNRLYLNQGKLQFKDITRQAGVEGRSLWKTGVTLADVNNDGWLDIYVCYSGPDSTHSLSNELYINNAGIAGGEPTFTEQAKLYGVDAPNTFSTQTSFFDYDRDGDLDMFLINHGNHFYSPFINTNKLRNTRHPNFGNRLYRNDSSTQIGGHRFFTEVSKEAGIHGGGINFSLGVSVSDVNEDGWPDIYVTNDYEEQDFLYLNNQNGTFTDCTKASFGHLSRNGMGTDLADFNNDGKPDLIEVDMWPEDNFRQKLLKGPDDYNRYALMVDSGFHHQQMRNTLQLNAGVGADGFPKFSEIGQLAGVSSTDWSWAPLWLDADNDGNKDLFVTNGYLRDFTSMDFLKYTVEEAKREAQKKGEELELYKLVSQMSSTKTSDYIFRNNGDLTFSDQTKEWGMLQPNLSFGAAYADLDNDGDLELITNNTNESACIWQNHSSDNGLNHFLSIKLEGARDNPFGIGAKVFVTSNTGSQMQELILTRGYESSVEPILHFGLGSNAAAEHVQVLWPDGKESTLKKVTANQLLKISYTSARSNEKPNSAPVTILFKDVSQESKIDFVHHENNFTDFDREPLLPYQFSKQGPALAAADVNEDGVDDFYIGGAAGQSGRLYVGDGYGHFQLAKQQPWNVDAEKEDIGATFFDVDGDGDQDLFVVSGGNEFENGSSELEDRLYINEDLKGFIKAPPGKTTVDHVNGSCVAAADYDQDGDLDLFVGGSVLPGQFPKASPGAILRNDFDPASRQFKLNVATQEVNPDLRELGIVTDALWTDFNNDHWPDLIVVGHWMPIRLFANEHGRLVEIKNKIKETSAGLWNRIASGDFDHDGDLDYVIGNGGLNLPWKVSVDQPLTLVYGDFNNDGRIDPIISSYTQGSNYPIASRDELLLQLSPLRKNFTNYATFGKATWNDLAVLLGINSENSRTLTVQTFASSFLENLGDGKFQLSELPKAAQTSSVNGLLVDDFTGDGALDILISGNFYPYRTQYGLSDASYSTLLRGNTKGEFKEIAREQTGLFANGDIRNMIQLSRGAKKSSILLSRNDNRVVLIECQKRTGPLH